MPSRPCRSSEPDGTRGRGVTRARPFELPDRQQWKAALEKVKTDLDSGKFGFPSARQATAAGRDDLLLERVWRRWHGGPNAR